MFALGFLTGITVMGFLTLLVLIYQPAIQRTINQTTSQFKEKGKIIEPEPEDMKGWIEKLPEL